MRMFTLTPKGSKIARSTQLKDSPATKVVYYLDKRDQATDEAIAIGTGLEYGEALAVLRNLQSHKIVTEVGKDELD